MIVRAMASFDSDYSTYAKRRRSLMSDRTQGIGISSGDVMRCAFAAGRDVPSPCQTP